MFINKELNPEGIYEVSAEELSKNLDQVSLIDVRRPDEWQGELGHIEDAILCTLGNELNEKLKKLPKEKPYVFVCRSGMRSLNAALAAKQMGFTDVYNLKGGMIAWNNR
jgi:rhodanese-related sulfurtransferase